MAPVPIYVVRHAQAEPRDAWAGSDRDRPLTGRGGRQAAALVGHFDIGADGSSPRAPRLRALEARPTLLLSSPAERCLATLGPLARACGLPVLTADFLSEGSEADSFLMRVKQLAAAGEIVVACTHGDVIWGTVDLLVAGGTRLEGSVDIKKGSTLVLEFESGSVASARYVPPDKV